MADEIDWKTGGFPKVMYEWCKECGVHSPIGYEKDFKEKVYILYTDRPGILIGKAGCTLAVYTRALQESQPGWGFKFKPVQGFVNYIEPGKKKRK